MPRPYSRTFSDIIDRLEYILSVRRRARQNWNILRVYVRTFYYGLWWYTYVGVMLCKPGGKWAESDCREFEEEFNPMALVTPF